MKGLRSTFLEGLPRPLLLHHRPVSTGNNGIRGDKRGGRGSSGLRGGFAGGFGFGGHDNKDRVEQIERREAEGAEERKQLACLFIPCSVVEGIQKPPHPQTNRISNLDVQKDGFSTQNMVRQTSSALQRHRLPQGLNPSLEPTDPLNMKLYRDSYLQMLGAPVPPEWHVLVPKLAQ